MTLSPYELELIGMALILMRDLEKEVHIKPEREAEINALITRIYNEAAKCVG